MKRIKVKSSLILAFVLVLGAISPVLAVTRDNSLTVENTGKTAHTFELYQIFKGDVVEGSRTLSNIEWGNGVKDPEGEASTVAEGLKTPADAATYAKEIQSKLQNPKTSDKVEAGGRYTFSPLDSGYYLVKDVAISQDQQESGAYTSYLLKVVGKVEVQTKLDVPTVEKYVRDINDSENAQYGKWVKTADHDMGDGIPFKLIGTLPTNYDECKTYKYIFHDTLSAGLTLDKNSIVVKVDDKKIDTGFMVETTESGFKVIFEDLKKVTGVTSTSKITVEYTGTLNDGAVIGSVGNPNEVYLEYSNDPNYEGQGTPMGKTPPDKVIVFTYKVIINKVREEKAGETVELKPLAGAEFKLEKKMTDGTYKLIENKVMSEDKTSFEFKGLDDGQYRLTETVTPAGYNTIEPIEFKIIANHDDETLKLTSLNGNAIEGSIELGLTSSLENGSLSADVVNKQGPELPETGGMGTKMIYVIGAIFVVGAAAYYFVERKISTDKK